MSDAVRITPAFTDAEATALAQFRKRSTWAQFRQSAESDEEAQLMINAIEEIGRCLARAGYAPR